MATARELLRNSRALQDAGQVEEALRVAKEALEKFRAEADQSGVAEALRPVLGGQIQLLEVTAEAAQKTVKAEGAKVRKTAPDGKVTSALLSLAATEVHLFRGESDQALKAATEADTAFSKEGEARLEAEAKLMLVNALLMRNNTPKALEAANGALAASQQSGDAAAQGAAWLSVATARHMAAADDAKEAAQRALGIFQERSDRANEAAAKLLIAQIELSTGDNQRALNAAQDALSIAKSTKNGPQAASAVEIVVDAQLASGSSQAALEEAESALAWAEQNAAGSHSKGVAATMAAVLVAHTACKGITSAIELVKKNVEQLRERGDSRGEVLMLHKLGTMSPIVEEALNSQQAALALAQKIGDASQEVAIRSSLTDLYAAKGKVERAPNRKIATKALSELAKALENKDGEKFDDAAKYLDGFYNALKQEDIEGVLGRAIAKDPTALDFLKEHGHMIGDDKPKATGCTAKWLPTQIMYFGFTSGGISYGPRYRINKAPFKRFNDETISFGIVKLSEQSAEWERELAYSPSLLDGLLQHNAAAGYDL